LSSLPLLYLALIASIFSCLAPHVKEIAMSESIPVPMPSSLSLGNLDIPLTQLALLLASPQLLPQLLREWIIEQAIAPVDLPPAANILEFTPPVSPNSPIVPSTAPSIRQQKIQYFKQQHWGAEIESHFLKRKPQLDRVVYSMLRLADPGLAQELYFRLQAQEQTFAELAQRFSQGPEAHTHGIVGPVPLGSLPPQLAQRLAGSQPGQLWQPISSSGSFMIIQLEHHLPTQLNPSMRQFLLDELFETWLREQIATHLPRSSSTRAPLPDAHAIPTAA
jgi:hypothetical protein